MRRLTLMTDMRVVGGCRRLSAATFDAGISQSVVNFRTAGWGDAKKAYKTGMAA
jgi:hypothetical protein